MRLSESLLLTVALAGAVSAAPKSTSSACASALAASISSSVSSKVAASASSKVSASVSSKVSASVSASVSAKVAASISSKLSGKTTSKTASTSAKSTAKSTSTSAKANAQSTSKASVKASSSSTKSTVKASSTTSTVTVPTDPTLIEYVIAPIPTFQGYANYSTKKPYAESAHFRIWGQDNENTTQSLMHLEGTWDCFINHLGWRSSGLSAYDYNDQPPYYKTNYFVYPGLVNYGATGETFEADDGLGFVLVDPDFVSSYSVVSHEFGHVMTLAEPSFWNSTNAFGWRETIAQFVAETYGNSPLCAASRTAESDTEAGGTRFDASTTIGQSFLTLVDATNSQYTLGNQYQAWPFLSYLTYNLDNYTGFGTDTMLTIFKTYKVNSNETPFHTIDRMAVAAGTTVQEIVGRYCARMAFVDYGSPIAQNYFQYLKPQVNYNNTFATGADTYQVYAARAPRYMGASIIPLNNVNSSITATVSAKTAYTAYLAFQGANQGATRYVELVATKDSGLIKTATEDVADGELAMLVVANTPVSLLTYDPMAVTTGPVSVGLVFNFTLDGATN